MEDGQTQPPVCVTADSEISPLVKKWLPGTSVEEQVIATENLRDYIEVLYRIYLRLESEGYFKKRNRERRGDIETR